MGPVQHDLFLWANTSAPRIRSGLVVNREPIRHEGQSLFSFFFPVSLLCFASHLPETTQEKRFARQCRHETAPQSRYLLHPLSHFSLSLIISHCSTHGDQKKKRCVCSLSNSVINLLTWQTLSQLCRLLQVHIYLIEIPRIMSVLFRWVLRTVVLRSSSHSLARRTILALAMAQGSELILDLVSEGNVGRESSNVRLRLTR